jgi:hypothetical protein
LDSGTGVGAEFLEAHLKSWVGASGPLASYRRNVLAGIRGDLLYEGNRHGAIFTVVLPPFSG